jgi:hypothetical protein
MAKTSNTKIFLSMRINQSNKKTNTLNDQSN